MRSRVPTLILALFSLLFGGWLAANYPIGQPYPLIVFVLFTALAYWKQWSWPMLLPAVLPVFGFAPWTGWLTFEELDMLILATAAGGYGNLLLHPPRGTARSLSIAVALLTGLMAVSLSISMYRGFSDAGGFAFGWYQGYGGPMNSIRIAKSFFLAWLLFPLIRQLHDQDKARLGRCFGYGLSIGLGLASLAAIWERLAFTDLLNFSSDYRTTALFWEMHVGGAALDGWLVLTVPFAIWLLRRAKTPLQEFSAFLLIGIAAYACLTTFSRGVYLALVIALPILGWMLFRRERTAGIDLQIVTWGPLQWILALVFHGVLALLVFPGSGYRGLLELLGLVIVSLAMPAVIRAMSLAGAITSILLGAIVGGGLVWLGNLIPKGAYLLYFLYFVFTLAALYWPGFGKGRRGFSPALVGFSGLGVAAVNCSLYWGGESAMPGIVGALSIIASIVLWGSLSRTQPWPGDLRWKGTMVVVSIAISGIVAIFSGGAYMGDRFSSAGKDAEGRLAHWNHAIYMLQSGADVVFGKGLGRFPANYFFSVPNSAFPGTYGIANENGNRSLAITGGRHPIGFGDLLRVSQRLSLSAQAPFQLDFRIRAKSDAVVHAEICEKHLLYVAQCIVRNVNVKATGGEWQHFTMSLDGPVFRGSSWFAPRFKVFSIGIENPGGIAEVDDLVLTEPGKGNILQNADFSNEMQTWFFSSDKNHLPWHAKNLQINTLFDQGAFGLLASLLLVFAALWQINIGRARESELSPYLTAGIVGFLVVGLFDSLTDVPRLAFIYYLLLLYSLASAVETQRKVRKSSRPRQEKARSVASTDLNGSQSK